MTISVSTTPVPGSGVFTHRCVPVGSSTAYTDDSVTTCTSPRVDTTGEDTPRTPASVCTVHASVSRGAVAAVTAASTPL